MNTLTPQDCYALMNDLVAQATGMTALKATDTSTFVSVGETVLRTGTENTLNALSVVLSRTIFSDRPYTGTLRSLRYYRQSWGGIMRKVTYLYNEAEPSTDYNTNLNPTQLADGNSIDMYKIKAPQVIQLNFYGTQKLQKHITRFRDQLSLAFSSEAEFSRFVTGVMIEWGNEIELLNEARTRGVLLNRIAAQVAMGLTVVDLVAQYNTEYGTTFTRGQLLTTEVQSFMQYVVARIKEYSARMVDMSVNNHASITGYKPILRHTPKSLQKMVMYNPFFQRAEATVFSQIFNPKYLEIGDFEAVNYWQNQDTPTAVNITPNILDVATGSSKTAESAVSIPYVLGILFDVEAMGVIPQYDYSSVTPFNSAGGYYNMYQHWRFNSFNDMTENAVLFVLGDGGAGV